MQNTKKLLKIRCNKVKCQVHIISEIIIEEEEQPSEPRGNGWKKCLKGRRMRKRKSRRMRRKN